MQIRVKCSCEETKCPEWAMVELQGIVQPEASFQHKLQNLQIGRLCRPSQEDYTFVVGYHELTGSRVKLKKPLLVLKKVKNNSSSVELDVTGIIRHKILFKTRPKALISTSQPGEKAKVNVQDS